MNEILRFILAMTLLFENFVTIELREFVQRVLIELTVFDFDYRNIASLTIDK